ncbi:MAG: hypothetical protein R6X35_03265 [Candidatus Krumholzibacteriia bacterium]
MRTALGTVLLAAALVAGIGASPADAPAASAGAAGPGTAAAPARLADTGLFAADGSIDPRNLPYSPQYPLWTDGAEKARWIFLPAGSRIDVGDVDAWRFPVGTKLWKEFAFAGHKVETRLIWHRVEGDWVYAAYVWNDEQTDAVLAPADGVPDAWEIAPGKRHAVPGTADCRACHEGGASRALGFSALQLSDDRDPLAPHAEPLPPGAVTLASLAAAGRLEPPRPELVTSPPRIRSADPLARAALGYLAGNCASCHNGDGPLARLGLRLEHDVDGASGAPEPALASAVDAAGRWFVPGVPADSSRIVAPGAPRHSALLHRMASRRPSSQMPPLGSVIADAEGLRLVRTWIEGLPLTDAGQLHGAAHVQAGVGHPARTDGPQAHRETR